MMSKSYIEPKPPLNQNIRYQLAKSRIDDLFLKWLSLPQSQKLIAQLMVDLKQGKTNSLITQPNPCFTNKMTMSGMSQSNILNSPSKIYKPSPSTPPRTELVQKQEDLSQSLTQSQLIWRKLEEDEKQQRESQIRKNYDQIPQFYFPDKKINQNFLNESIKLINETFGNKDLDVVQFEQITINICELPKHMNKLLIQQLDLKNGKVTAQSFIKYWQQNLVNKDPKQRCFHVFKKPQNDHITFEDFRPFMKILLESHPGLEFLQATPEFQDRYAETVIHRIFYKLCKKDNNKICWREFKQSDFFTVLEQVSKEDDINKVRQYFSYEHFYVIYCKFWELDGDHDFHITKEDFTRYNSHGLSKKVVDRIFDQVPRKFKSIQPGKMSYEDFIYFILSEEDKTTHQSIEYWFKIIDLDDNGIISGQEMEFFFDEIKQRMEYLNHEPILFQDFLCQMVDLLKPEKDILFKLHHFKTQMNVCGVFFNFLSNLNKLVAYENRDPFQMKNELTEHPDFSEWDRFANQEYLRLAMEEENQEPGEVFEGENIWDNEQEEQK
ncbi:hypothetical protein pb186bvf_011090 [Paramecium bursaria]